MRKVELPVKAALGVFPSEASSSRTLSGDMTKWSARGRSRHDTVGSRQETVECHGLQLLEQPILLSFCETELEKESNRERVPPATNQKTTSDPKSSSVQRHRALTIFQNQHLARSTANSHCYRKRDNNVHADFNWYTELEDTVWGIQIPCCIKGIGITAVTRSTLS